MNERQEHKRGAGGELDRQWQMSEAVGEGQLGSEDAAELRFWPSWRWGSWE